MMIKVFTYNINNRISFKRKLIAKIIMNICCFEYLLKIFLYLLITKLNKAKRNIDIRIMNINLVNAENASLATRSVKNIWDPKTISSLNK